MLTIVIGALWLVLDLWTKRLIMTGMAELQEIPIIPGFFSIQFVYNPGAAFGMLAHYRWLFIAVTLGVMAAIIYVALRRPEAKHGGIALALGLLLGGAAGNMIDRIRFGEVVDFFLFYWRSYRFPNFNVADIGISVGVGLLILLLMINGESKQREGI